MSIEKKICSAAAIMPLGLVMDDDDEDGGNLIPSIQTMDQYH